MHWEALEGSSQLELATTMSMLSTKGSPVGTTPCQHQMGATQKKSGLLPSTSYHQSLSSLKSTINKRSALDQG